MIMLLLQCMLLELVKNILRDKFNGLSLVGLSQKAKMYPNELSGGEQQELL